MSLQGHTLVQMHVTDWAEAQKEDPMHWAQCSTGWRHKRRQILRHFWQNTPPVKKAGWSYAQLAEFYDSSRSLVPALNTQRWDQRSLYSLWSLRTHCVATLNGCHRDVGHHIMWPWPCLCYWEHFWWPGMTNQMLTPSIKPCTCITCNMRGNLSKVPLHPIVATALNRPFACRLY